MMQSKSQTKSSTSTSQKQMTSGQKRMTSRPTKTLNKQCQACAYMVWELGIEPPSKHHITHCPNFKSTMLKKEASGRLDWRNEPNDTTKLKYPNMSDSFTGSQIFDIHDFRTYYLSLPNLTENTSASSNINRVDSI